MTIIISYNNISKIDVHNEFDGSVEGWAKSVGNLAGVSCKHLQSYYSGMQKQLQ